MVPLFQLLLFHYLQSDKLFLLLNESAALAPLNSTILPLLFTSSISLQYCCKLPDVFESLLLYSTQLYIGITISISSALSTCILFILQMQLNGAQFLKITFLLASLALHLQLLYLGSLYFL